MPAPHEVTLSKSSEDISKDTRKLIWYSMLGFGSFDE